MHLERLELVDFRSFRHVEVDLQPGACVLVGANAQGKTNLLEAVTYLSLGRSHRVATDAPLVRQGAEAAIVRALARSTDNPSAGKPGRPVQVELELRPGGRGRARIDGQQQERVADAVGVVRSVLFAPEDLALVRGDPADRRRFLDDLLTQRRPAYAVARQEFERVLRQRNALLKQVRAGAVAPSDATLGVWTAALARAGATVLAARIAAVHALARPTAASYAELVVGAPGGKAATEARLVYELSSGRRVTGDPQAGVPDPGGLVREIEDALRERAHAEQERGMTLVGPHRDELVLELGDLPAKGFASHGESWSLVLALRLASREVLREVGEEPVVLLDDVFAELDERRREMLAERCAAFEQVLVTAAVDGDVPLRGARYQVEDAVVTPLPAGPRSVTGGAA